MRQRLQSAPAEHVKTASDASRNENADACIYASGSDSDATATAKPGPPCTATDAGTRTAASAGGDVDDLLKRRRCLEKDNDGIARNADDVAAGLLNRLDQLAEELIEDRLQVLGAVQLRVLVAVAVEPGGGIGTQNRIAGNLL